MKNIILGKNGLLGSCFTKSDTFKNYISLSHNDLDITDYLEVEQIILKHNPKIIINCTAYTNVTEAELDKTDAFLVNCSAVENLAKLCNKYSIKLVHFSTDYVFKGNIDEEYKEEQKTNSVNIYGNSKLCGELQIKKHLMEFLIIRISWLFGEGGKNFVSIISKLIKERESLNIVSDQMGKVTYTEDVVVATQKLLELNASGIYHFANNEKLSRYDFTVEILRLMKIIDPKIDCIINPITAEEYPDKTPRPQYSCLNLTKYEELTNSKIRNWKSAIADLFGVSQ